MDDLRAVVATALALTSTSRLVAIDAGDLVEADTLAVYAAVATGPTSATRAVVADPLRLPFVAALADLVVARIDAASEPVARLREVWRLLAPAGALVLIVAGPSSHSLNSLILRQIIRRRVTRQLAGAMFEVAAWQVAGSAAVVRAVKRDGLAPQRRSVAAVQAPVTA